MGPLLFNIFVCNLFEFLDDDINAATFGDDKIPYVTAEIPEIIIENIEKSPNRF